MFVTVDPDGPMKQKVIYAMTDRSIPTYQVAAKFRRHIGQVERMSLQLHKLALPIAELS